jgi:moderate conductance mechanosensitive channel
MPEALVVETNLTHVWMMAGIVTGTSWLLIALIAGVIIFVSRSVTKRLEQLGSSLASEGSRMVHDLVRRVVLVVAVLVGLAIAGLCGWLVWEGTDPVAWGLSQLRAVNVETWTALAVACGKLLVAGLVLIVVVGFVRRLLTRIHAKINQWDGLKDNDKSLDRLFLGLDKAIVISAWLGFATIGSLLINLPPWCGALLAAVTRIYAIIAIGFLVLRATAVVVDTSDALSHRYAEKRGWLRFYDQLRPLVPLLRRCLELALYITIASLVFNELPKLDGLAAIGPMLVQVIGIFFVGRVAIEAGNLAIAHWMLNVDRLDDTERRRRSTIVPLARSVFKAACWFVIVVLGLTVLGFDTTPFLAGAGVIGMVVGLGAKDLINDVVSGFFILFENVYLVGDVVEGGGAKGTVESIEFRTTRIRDADGRLHIIRNGDMKQVVNYSKEFTRSVVAFEVGYDADVQRVFRTITECGERFRNEHADVLGEIEIDGISGFSGTAMTIRTSVKVRPGRHEVVAAQWRLVLKEAFDQLAQAGAPRKGLVPEIPSA